MKVYRAILPTVWSRQPSANMKHAVPAKIISAMLGHSSIGITMDTYSHVLTDMQEGATSKMNTLLKKLY